LVKVRQLRQSYLRVAKRAASMVKRHTLAPGFFTSGLARIIRDIRRALRVRHQEQRQRGFFGAGESAVGMITDDVQAADPLEFDRLINAGRRPFGRVAVLSAYCWAGGWCEKKKVPIGRARRRPIFATDYLFQQKLRSKSHIASH